MISNNLKTSNWRVETFRAKQFAFISFTVPCDKILTTFNRRGIWRVGVSTKVSQRLLSRHSNYCALIDV